MKNHTPKKTAGRKAQVFTWDIAIATSFFMLAILMIILLWNNATKEILDSSTEYDTNWLATTASELLVRTPGRPLNWSHDPRISRVVSFGLTDTKTIENSTKASDRIIDPDKLIHFLNLTQTDYYEVRAKLLGSGTYDLYLELSCLEGSDLYCLNDLSLATINQTVFSCANDVNLTVRESNLTGEEDLAGFWKFDEGGGLTAEDKSGNGNTGNLSGGVNWTSGRHGYGLGFDGLNDYVNAGNGSSLAVPEKLTVAAWIKPGFDYLDGSHHMILDKYKPAGGGYWILFNYQLDGFRFKVDSPSDSRVIDYSTPFAAGEWHHLAGTYDGSVMSMYFDGQPVNASTYSSAGINVTDQSLTIGSIRGVSAFFNGTIDDVRIYNRSLSAREILDMYSETRKCVVGLNESLSEMEYASSDTKTFTFATERNTQIDVGEDLPMIEPTARMKAVVYKTQTNYTQ